MQKLHLVYSLLWATSLIAWCSSLHGAERPNVLLICVDDLKPNLACFGDQVAKSPNIDRLAQRAVMFERAYCNQAVCSPSRNALLTSLRPQTLGIYDLGTNFRKSRPDAITLPQVFKQHGYHTEALGKIFHTGHGNHEDAASWSVPHWRAKTTTYAEPGNKPASDAPRPTAVDGKSQDSPKGRAYESADVPDNTYADGALADEVIERLRAAQGRSGQPFFIAAGFVKPHLPFVAPKKYWDLYQASQLPLAEVRQPPQGAPEYAPQYGGELRQYLEMPAAGAIDEALQRKLVHGYYAATSYMDAQVGRVLAELDRLNLTQNTIVVLWGDHGWHLGDHGMWCKHTNYEQATRIPLLVAAPNAARGQRSSMLVESVDVYPTLCELAGLPAADKLDGRSFAATLKDPTHPTKDYIQHVYPRNSAERGSLIGRAIRTDRYRLVQWKKIDAAVDTAEWELYDYIDDPLETKNFASARPDVVAKLSALLAGLPEAKPQVKEQANSSASKAAQDRGAMFERRDKDQDGQLSRQEFLANQSDPDKAPARFMRLDKDQNGKLSRQEFVESGSKK